MQTGHCPKCQSTQVYRRTDPLAAYEMIALRGGVISHGAAPEKYLCLACGYLELYLPLSPEQQEIVRADWEHVQG
jgi:predicted nucleic-acid-binding Zn-ribbon protein